MPTPVSLMALLPSALLFGCVILLFARWSLPFTPPPAGEPLTKLPLPFRSRVRAQRLNVYSVAAVMMLGAIGGWLSTGAEIALLVAVTIALFIPIRYTLTDEEITLGRTAPHRWSAFSDVEVLRGRAVLRGADGEADLPVWLPGAQTDDERIVSLLRQRVRLAARERTGRHGVPQRGITRRR